MNPHSEKLRKSSNIMTFIWGFDVPVVDSVDVLTPELADEFVKNFDRISLCNVTDLDLDSAKAIARVGHILALDGLSKLCPETANVLTRHEGLLSLGGIKCIDDDRVAVALLSHDFVLMLDGIEALSPGIVKMLEIRRRPLSLNGLRSIALDESVKLAESSFKLSLLGIKNISPVSARLLLSKKDVKLSDVTIARASHLGAVTLEDLQAIVRVVKRIDEPTITQINDEGAEYIAALDMDISLPGLTCISDITAKHFSNHRGCVNLNGIEELSNSAVFGLTDQPVNFSKAEGSHRIIYWGSPRYKLGGLVRVSPEAALVLAHADGIVVGDEVRKLASKVSTLTAEVAENLSKLKPLIARPYDSLELDCITRLDSGASKMLARYRGQIILDGLSSISAEDALNLATHSHFLNSAACIAATRKRHLRFRFTRNSKPT